MGIIYPLCFLDLYGKLLGLYEENEECSGLVYCFPRLDEAPGRTSEDGGAAQPRSAKTKAAGAQVTSSEPSPLTALM